MSGRDVTSSFAATLVDEWARGGVTHAVVSPGSRNAPLLLALSRNERITVDVVLDERSAAFRALGVALASGRPTVVCCTSGTAAANFHPAVVEAHHACVPLIVCTADRPPELRDWGAAQTIDQARLYGRAVNWFFDPGPPDLANSSSWRPLACRAVLESIGPPSGPVHLNLPFREPLVPTGEPLVEIPGRAHDEPWTRAVPTPSTADAEEFAALVRAHPRGVIVAGARAQADRDVVSRFAAAAGWPILPDPLSQLRQGPFAISTYEAFARAQKFRPEIALRLGASLTSKAANAWLADVPHVIAGAESAWLDPDRTGGWHINADVSALLRAAANSLEGAESPWLAAWCDAERTVRSAIDKELDGDETPCEARIARDLARTSRGPFVVASSLPVRALEWAMAPHDDLHVYGNRGANGIDGFVSTALGISKIEGPTTALCGDLSFLHDIGALATADETTPVTFVVIDNGGGAIFSYLPQHDLPGDEFVRLFLTPAHVDLDAVARAYARASVRVEVVTVDGDAARQRHAQMWQAAATALA
jgi:2-succinyl-5-enolpyruvyl-6-hydroxy-3-cyclohexene-1-carboxylate synthase